MCVFVCVVFSTVSFERRARQLKIASAAAHSPSRYVLPNKFPLTLPPSSQPRKEHELLIKRPPSCPYLHRRIHIPDCLHPLMLGEGSCARGGGGGVRWGGGRDR